MKQYSLYHHCRPSLYDQVTMNNLQHANTKHKFHRRNYINLLIEILIQFLMMILHRTVLVCIDRNCSEQKSHPTAPVSSRTSNLRHTGLSYITNMFQGMMLHQHDLGYVHQRSLCHIGFSYIENNYLARRLRRLALACDHCCILMDILDCNNYYCANTNKYYEQSYQAGRDSVKLKITYHEHSTKSSDLTKQANTIDSYNEAKLTLNEDNSSTNGGCFSQPIYPIHKHQGNETNGGACYTAILHEHKDSCYTTKQRVCGTKYF